MRRQLIALAAISVIAISVCAYFVFRKPDCSNTSRADQAYLQMIRDSADFESKALEGRWGDIFFSNQFIEYYENACPHYQSAVSVIRSREFNTGQKMVAVISMQDLPGPVYFDFGSEVLSSYRAGTVSDEVLMLTFSPYLELRKSRHQWYFWHPEWRRQLKDAQALVERPAFKRAIERKLGGSTLVDWLTQGGATPDTP